VRRGEGEGNRKVEERESAFLALFPFPENLTKRACCRVPLSDASVASGKCEAKAKLITDRDGSNSSNVPVIASRHRFVALVCDSNSSW